MNKTFYNLADYVNKPLSTDFQENGKWQRFVYEAKGEMGAGLVCGTCNNPGAIEIDLKVKGWHKVYFALGTMGGPTGIQVEISNQPGKTLLHPTNIDMVEGVFRWQGYDYCEESFFRALDLTDVKFIISKPQNMELDYTQVILYIRVEEMSDKDVEAYKNSGKDKRIMYHFDVDYLAECDYEKPEDYLGRINTLDHGYGDVLVQELFIDSHSDPEYNKNVLTWKGGHTRWNNKEKYRTMSSKVQGVFSKKAHELGMEIYAGYRITMADFKYPFHPSMYNDGLVDKYPQYFCKTRDGREMQVLSYAYKEVHKLSIDKIVSTLPDSWDGVSLFFHRGLYIAFEQPVIDEVKKRYGIDARILKRSDPRLNSVMCEFITDFIRDLKVALKEKADKANHAEYKINVVTLFSHEDTKNYGCDVEALLKEGLIASVSQGLMTHYEEIDDCLDQNGYVDLEKYKEKKKTKFVQRRYFGDDSETVCEGSKQFLEIVKKYGGEYYGALGWENKDYQYQLDLAKDIYNLGVEKLISWNANHIAKYGSKLQGVKACGDKENVLKGDCKVVSNNFRLTVVNGRDLSEFDCNWRG